jgi:hypothetical protein
MKHQNYTVYFQIDGKKKKMQVQAISPEAAKMVVCQKMIQFDKVEDNLQNIFSQFGGIFGNTL